MLSTWYTTGSASGDAVFRAGTSSRHVGSGAGTLQFCTLLSRLAWIHGPGALVSDYYIFRGVSLKLEDVKHVFQSVSRWERPMFHRVSSVSSQTFDLEVFLFDNRALTEVCQKALDQDMPKMTDLNQVLDVKWGVVQVRCNCDDVFPSLVEILKLCPKSIPWKSWWVSTLFWQLSCGCSGSVFSISWDHFEWYERLHLLHIPKLALQHLHFSPFQQPNFKTSEVVARCMSGITSCLRYTGPLNADLRKLQTNLVPFKNAHFLISGLAPLTAKASEKYRKSTVQDIAQQMFSKDNVTVKCDPLNPGDDYHGILKARFLASWASWRGDYATKEVDRVLYDLQKDTHRVLVPQHSVTNFFQ